MCIVRQKALSTEDLAFLTASRFPHCEPDEEAINRSLSIHDEEAELVCTGPVCLSQIVQAVKP